MTLGTGRQELGQCYMIIEGRTGEAGEFRGRGKGKDMNECF